MPKVLVLRDGRYVDNISDLVWINLAVDDRIDFFSNSYPSFLFNTKKRHSTNINHAHGRGFTIYCKLDKSKFIDCAVSDYEIIYDDYDFIVYPSIRRFDRYFWLTLERFGGEKVIAIDGEDAYKITKDEVVKKLRGRKGTKVDISVQRIGQEKPFDVTIIRDDIPIYSVGATTMLDEDTGYILLRRFSATTIDEVNKAIDKLDKQNFKAYINLANLYILNNNIEESTELLIKYTKSYGFEKNIIHHLKNYRKKN